MKKGFILMESIVVILVVTVSLLTLFSAYNRILSKVKTENKYDTAEYIYMTYQIKKILKQQSTSSYEFDMSTSSSSSPYDISTIVSNNFNNYTKLLNIKKAYILYNINKSTTNNLKKFDAYMIDYIRKLDVDDEKLLIIEYNRPILISDTAKSCGNNKCDTLNNILNETYIASLRWN